MNSKFALLLIGALASSAALADNAQHIVVGQPWVARVPAFNGSFTKNGQNNFFCKVIDESVLAFSATPITGGKNLMISVTGKIPSTGDNASMVCAFGAQGTGSTFLHQTFNVTASK